MARTGRPTTPPQLHVLRGTWRADRHNFDAPEVKKRRPRRPKYFSGAKRKLWNALVRELDDAGILSSLNGGVIKRLVNWSVTSDEVWEKLSEKTLYPEDHPKAGEEMKLANKFQQAESGYISPSALIILARMADEMSHKCETELGMTPQSLTRLRIEKKPQAPSKVRAFLK